MVFSWIWNKLMGGEAENKEREDKKPEDTKNDRIVTEKSDETTKTSPAEAKQKEDDADTATSKKRSAETADASDALVSSGNDSNNNSSSDAKADAASAKKPRKEESSAVSVATMRETLKTAHSEGTTPYNPQFMMYQPFPPGTAIPYPMVMQRAGNFDPLAVAALVQQQQQLQQNGSANATQKDGKATQPAGSSAAMQASAFPQPALQPFPQDIPVPASAIQPAAAAQQPVKKARKKRSSFKDFDGLFARMEKFRSVHGHCNVPYKHPEDPELSSWVQSLRRKYAVLRNPECTTKVRLTAEQIEKLDGLGFEWVLRRGRPAGSSNNSKTTTKMAALKKVILPPRGGRPALPVAQTTATKKVSSTTATSSSTTKMTNGGTKSPSKSPPSSSKKNV